MTEDPGGGRGAAERVDRLLVLAAGVGALVFGALASPQLLEQAPLMQPGWTLTAILTLLGLPVLAGALAFTAPLPVLRGMAGAQAAAFLLTQLSWAAALQGNPMPDGDRPWILQLTALPCALAALAWPRPLAMGYLVAATLGSGLLRWATAPADAAALAAQDALYALLYCAVFVAPVQVVRRSAAEEDAAARTAAIDAARAAGSAARLEDRAHLDALVHDEVLLTLLTAARSRADDPAVRQKARRALAQLDGLRATPLVGTEKHGEL